MTGSKQGVLNQRDVEFASGGVVLREWLRTPDTATPSPLAILAHGLGGLKEWTIPDVASTIAYSCRTATIAPSERSLAMFCSRTTRTNFFNVVGTEDVGLGVVETLEHVVQVALRALERGRPSVILGRRNALRVLSERFVPRALVARMGVRLMRPGHSDKQPQAQ